MSLKPSRNIFLFCGALACLLIAVIGFGGFAVSPFVVKVDSAVVETVTNAAPALTAPPPSAYPNIAYDFDGDGKADIGRWHGANTEFKVRETDSGNYLI